MLDATQTVFGAGSQRARVVLVGEQPGDQEDRSGEPFVGPAGKLLDRALTDAAIDRKVRVPDEDRDEAYERFVADLKLIRPYVS